jgi:NitT/TauT family transport system ATP-binding protein
VVDFTDAAVSRQELGRMQAKRPKVTVRNLMKEFSIKRNGKPETIRALNEVSFDVHDGELVAFTGRSGCGKTTTLRLIMGLEQATAGAIEVDGRRVTRCGFDRGMVFQHAELLAWRTALANVEFGLEAKGIPAHERRKTALKMLEMVGLSHSLDRRPYQLSGGMKQRVGLARAFATDPEVLLMDEPFAALDAQTREALQTELISLHERTGKTTIFVTHDLDEAVLLADRVFIFSPTGEIHEIVDIDIPHPRDDVIAIRGSDEFQKKRFYIWKTLKMTDKPQAE